MKGTMATQTFKGLQATAPFHWRGDRSNFQAFNGAFSSLMGGSLLSTADMNHYTQFATSIAFPPNPNQLKDRTLRTLAEMENLRRRTEREVADAKLYGVTKFAGDMVGFADNLRRAVESVPADARDIDAVKAAAKTLHTEFTRIEREARVQMEAEKRRESDA
jgi:molecular chaperone GrpE (heat shock protein)